MKSSDSYAPSAPRPKSAPIRASFGKQTGQAAAAMRPPKRLVDGDAVADREIRQAPFGFRFLGTAPCVGARDDRRDAALVELSDHAVQLACVLAAHGAVQSPVEHDHGEVLWLLHRERPMATSDGVEFERGNGLSGF